MPTTSSPAAVTPQKKQSSRKQLQDIALIAVFAALIIVLAFVSIPVGTAGVPIVLQNASIVLAGLVLGGRRGFLTALLFLGLGLIGLPVLAGGRTTLTALAGPTAGYIVGYLISPLVAGLIAYLAPKKRGAGMFAILGLAALAGLLVQYFCGIVGLVLRAGLSVTEATISQGAFVIPDLAKFAFMIVIAAGVHAAFPDLRKR
ncbi:biotin transporter BioY [Corynebacterium deserti]|nr:biotin transporter BioY [Corynebacterium deserti]